MCLFRREFRGDHSGTQRFQKRFSVHAASSVISAVKKQECLTYCSMVWNNSENNAPFFRLFGCFSQIERTGFWIHVRTICPRNISDGFNLLIYFMLTQQFQNTIF
ncbi:MAG: hypothetical protein DRI57_09915 [Deltaproteobacteria bacterium]|nr:MAG: hypothetical protein DRI57_09915 [Deltaproteobacteria bacterium]